MKRAREVKPKPVDEYAKTYPNSKRRRIDPTVTQAAELDEFWDIRDLGEQGPLYRFLQKKLPELAARGEGDSPTGWDLLTEYTSGPKEDLGYLPDLHVKCLTAVNKAKALGTLSQANSAAIAAQLASYTPQAAANGELRIAFLAVGSGDCILVRTPGGLTLAIDCGTRGKAYAGQNTHIAAVLRDFLGAGNTTLFALILTHADIDHHRDVADAFFTNAATSCLHVFYSLNIGRYGTTTATLNTLIAGGAMANELRLRPGAATIHTSSATPADQTLHYELTQPNPANGNNAGGSLQIIGNSNVAPKNALVAWQENGCEVHLLAAGVGQNGNVPTSDPNPASIVTLIKYKGRKILLTGDAETSTEAYLRTHHEALITDIDLLHVEHHGSGTTSHAGQPFVDRVDPRVAVISSGRMDRNPRWNLLDKYVDGHRLCTTVDKHNLLYGLDDKTWCDMNANNDWTGDPDPNNYSADYRTHAIYTTHSNGDLVFAIDINGLLWRRWSIGATRYTYSIDAAGNYRVYRINPDDSLTELLVNPP